MASALWIVCLILFGNISVIIQAQIAGNFGAYPYSGYGQPQPYPVIIKSDKDNDWGHILPILLLLLCDNWGGWGGGWGGGGWGGGSWGGCGGCCGGGCSGCSCGCGCGGGGGCNTIPIPYPIPIPINNPIIT